ncbi:hypothetical protein TWF970_000414 [Orbilia oligospora]|nr:hypothetical protein TWF970_000414 [Orbilia oligospora]
MNHGAASGINTVSLTSTYSQPNPSTKKRHNQPIVIATNWWSSPQLAYPPIKAIKQKETRREKGNNFPNWRPKISGRLYELAYIQSHLPPSLRTTDVNLLLTIILIFVIPITLLLPMKRFLKSVTGSSLFDDDESRTEDVVYVQQGAKTYSINFPKGEVDTKTTVKDLRLSVLDALGLSHEHSIKLLFSGSHLKDDAALLKDFKVKHGAKILCMASKSKLAPPPSASGSAGSSSRNTPEPPKKKIIPPMEKIELVRKHITGAVLPLVEAFEANPPEDQAKRRDEHHRLSETVLGEMLKLDSVDVDGDDGAEVRKKRKVMVKELHAILERLDKVDKPV